jgi:hypothetical protein
MMLHLEAFVEANQTKERQSSQLVKKFSTLSRVVSSGQSEEAMYDFQC